MKKIQGREKPLIDLLANKKYTIHYYQREYRWGRKQIEELIDDLAEEFLEHYREADELEAVDQYGHYYLGSVVLSTTDNDNAIIDGQQRLTSLTLLLIYLNNLQKERKDKISIDRLIFSERHLKKTFNIKVEERKPCLNALFNEKPFDPTHQSESIRNIFASYQDIEDIFPEELKGRALPFFVEWLIYKVYLVEITAQTEQDANKIFVTMNDRGLNLTPTEMLKGYLLSRISDDATRNQANDVWKAQILKLKDLGKDEDAAFLKNWLRAHYAETIRQTKKGAIREDYDLIGNPFHKWVRQNAKRMGLEHSADYTRFVLDSLVKYSKVYIRLMDYSETFTSGYEHVFYNANRNFTLQYQIILAAIDTVDEPEIINRKIKAVSRFLDQYIAVRVFNFKMIDYSTIKNAMFTLTLKVRRLPLSNLVHLLQQELASMGYDLDGIDSFYLNQFTKRYMLHVLARMTHYIEQESGRSRRFEDYVSRVISNPYDVEHIWANKYDRHRDEFDNEELFNRARNSFGALLMLPRDVNRSLQDKPYAAKLDKYYSQNLLAASLNQQAYQNNPQFLRFMERSNVAFKHHPAPFKIGDIQERRALYKAICKQIWNPDLIAEAVAP